MLIAAQDEPLQVLSALGISELMVYLADALRILIITQAAFGLNETEHRVCHAE